jgi:hypothetical protein
MSEQFMLLPVVLINQQMVTEIHRCNNYTEKYGLQLTDTDIHELVENRRETLEKNGRIEFGGGVIHKIIVEFADSPYINQDNYLETLEGLQECFYYYKNETKEDLSDDELIQLMKKYFDHECQGSIDYLETTILENYSRDIRYGTEEYRNNNGYDNNYDEFMDLDDEEYDD